MNDNEKYIEEFVNDIPFDAPDNEHQDKLKKQLLNAFPKHRLQPTIHTVNVRRTIMKSPFIKVAAAAIIAVSISLTRLIPSTPAFAEIIRPLLTARTATFKMTMAIENGPTQSFDCMFMEPMHMRQISSGAIVISDLQEGKILTLVPEQNKAMVVEMENMPENEDQSQFNMFHGIRKHIQEAQETEDKSVSFLGEKEINGMTTIGYHVQRPEVNITVWADPQTKLPVQMENKMGPVTYTMTDIVFNVELEESLFSLNIPNGYTVRTMKVDASEPTEKDLVEMFRIWAEHMDGNLPSVLDMNAQMEFVKYQRKKMKEKGQEPSEESMLELQKTIMKMSRGGMFVQNLPTESNWRYAGADVKFGDSEKAIFWYRPEGSVTYRVIYADLNVKDVSEEDLSK